MNCCLLKMNLVQGLCIWVIMTETILPNYNNLLWYIKNEKSIYKVPPCFCSCFNNQILFGSQVHSTIKEYPVLIMPTHRSYFDFLLVSFVFFAYELPLPVIAAAMGMCMNAFTIVMKKFLKCYMQWRKMLPWLMWRCRERQLYFKVYSFNEPFC